ncbi:MAG: hypothetical protein Q7S13_01305 [Candidatus Omnitrophota bacterium]|nr:hypothetical protein [Candidatus Omnitrophota bacterium]
MINFFKACLNSLLVSCFLLLSQCSNFNAENAELSELYPKVENFKAHFHAEALTSGKKDYEMNGIIYFQKPNNFRMEFTWSDNESVFHSTRTFDGRYQWQYYEEQKFAERQDTELLGKELKMAYGYLPLYTFDADITYAGREIFKDESIKKFIVRPSKKIKKLAPDIDDKRIFLIGEEDGIVRALYFYNPKGELIFFEEFYIQEKNADMKKVQFTFNPPKGSQVKFMP